MTSPRVLAGRYRLDAEIGRGSMGSVWDAYDQVLRRRVAIKQVDFPAGMPVGEVEQLADRTLREARAIAALSHPHVITLYDILTLPTGPVIVMELMRAPSLAQILASEGPLDDTRAAVVGAAVADGLMAAHAAGITHRDVKPANVLIGGDGRIKLTDFGIARSVDEHTMTATGMLLGSPAYISPEVASGRPATPAADAWGLGALLFATVQGHPPYDRGEPIATLTAVVTDPVPPHPHSGRLGGVIDALLVKDPARRMPVQQARMALAGVAGGFSGAVVTTRPAATPPSGRPADVSTGTRPDRRVGTPRPAPAFAAPGPVPPPPWAAEAAGNLKALPATAPPRRRAPIIAAAILVLLAAAAAGYFGVLAIAGLA